ncbi:MAG: co-chaperone GroES, partial [Planctomycetota bacterium]
AAGPGKQLESGERAPMGVAPKDLVLIGKYSGTEVTVEGDEYVILRESDILAKVNE